MVTAGGLDDPATWTAKQPGLALLRARRRLTGPGSAKDTRHLEIEIPVDGPGWEPGDSLGVIATNHPDLVAAICALDGLDPEAPVRIAATETTLASALASQDIARIPKALLELVAERLPASDLAARLATGERQALSDYTSGRDVLDLLRDHPEAGIGAQDLVDRLREILPRLYSIASSPAHRAGSCHLTVNLVYWRAHGRDRRGVASTWLGERLDLDAPLPCFVHTSKKFRLPSDGRRDAIMIGPGTGIAPFRAFLQHRQIAGDRGRNWLFFGEQHRASDFLYRDELETWLHDGLLARLDLAFSRDQEHKVYVQHRMRESARELWAWIERGAHVYVCGDALRMAKDVDRELHALIAEYGAMNEDVAAAYVKDMKKNGRYQRDVYAV